MSGTLTTQYFLKKQNQFLKIDKRFEHFTQENKRMANKLMYRRSSTTLVIREMQIKTAIRRNSNRYLYAMFRTALFTIAKRRKLHKYS